ncbi:hypothetical protein RJT34_01553 [Clitoria ternatea]|uniref:Uncharacterized protein n=1 Tax=Clitoria ternatea TaxID=43366 RepID=A0AAN9KJJ0_CLITE
MMMKGSMKGRMEQERDRDEDLTLFSELRKRQNERISSLLHCVSEEYEYDANGASGKFSLYRIPSSGKKEYGLDFLETSSKNDYDWLKTPPATPLFPSLEMEPSAQLVVQKEIPISQPISRFARSEVEAAKPKANHTDSTKAKLPKRSITPSHNRQRPSIIKNTTNEHQISTRPTIPNKSTTSNANIEHDATINNTKSTPQKQPNNADFFALDAKKTIETNESQRKPKARGVSPSVRSKIVISNVLELSNVAPPNLRTEQRSSSTTRGRSTTRASSIVVGIQYHDPTPKACRPLRSPSPSMANGAWNQSEKSITNLRAQKDTFTLAASNTNESRAHFKGSKMVEKVVNARKSNMHQVDKETKPKSLKYKHSTRPPRTMVRLKVFAAFCLYTNNRLETASEPG